jgi:hypothetical protein
MKKSKRIITAHKGGRTVQVKFTCTPEEKETINQAKGERSLSDYILWMIEKTKWIIE